MPTATTHIDSLIGFAGPARCYTLDPPYRGHSYVTICVTPSFGQIVGPRADIFPATESGACSEPSLKARGGSFNLHDDADTPERLEGAYAVALWLLGGYQITEPVPAEDVTSETA